MLFSGRGAQGIILNTAGGVTGGDSFATQVHVAPDSACCLTTQAAERLYCAQGTEEGRIDTRVTVAGKLTWLPQETIVFNGARVRRRFEAEIGAGGRLLFVEPVVYGRLAMGESLTQAAFRDSVTLRREGALLYRDTVQFEGDIARQLDRPAIGNGARAMALVLYAGPDAEAYVAAARRVTPAVSLIREGLLAARLLAADAFDLRRALVPLITQFTDLPRSWSL